MSSNDITQYTRRTTLGSSVSNPLYTKLIVKGAPSDDGSVLMKYRANLQAMAQSNMFKAETFNALKDKYKNRYGKYTNGAINWNNLAWEYKVTFDNGQQNMSYADYMNAKLNVLRNNIDNYRN